MTIKFNKQAVKNNLSFRLQEELKFLEKIAPNLIVGHKTIETIQYTAILLKRIPLSSRKFKVTNSDIAIRNEM